MNEEVYLYRFQLHCVASLFERIKRSALVDGRNQRVRRSGQERDQSYGRQR